MKSGQMPVDQEFLNAYSVRKENKKDLRGSVRVTMRKEVRELDLVDEVDEPDEIDEPNEVDEIDEGWVSELVKIKTENLEASLAVVNN